LRQTLLILGAIIFVTGCQTHPVQPQADVPIKVESKVPGYLDKAYAAYQQGNLLEPTDTSALGWYNKVLENEPDNTEAKRGLELILSHYHDIAKRAIVKQHWQLAANNLLKADRVIADHPETFVIAAQLANAQQHRHQAAQRWSLNPRDLQSKNDAIQQQLRAIAVKIKQLDAPATIYAPSDSLGRWIYVQLNNESLNYRIRGDLRISTNARIEVR